MGRAPTVGDQSNLNLLDCRLPDRQATIGMDKVPWIASFGTRGALATERFVLPSAGKRSATMKNDLTHLTIEEITQIAARKLEQAAALAPSREKEELLRSAENFRALAEVKA